MCPSPSTVAARRLLGWLAGALVVALVLGIAPAAQAGQGSAAARREAQRARLLDRQAQRQAKDTDAARRHLEQLSTQANAALDALQQATEATRDALSTRRVAEARLIAARERTAAARERLDEYAADAYRSGAGATGLGTALSLTDGDARVLLDGLSLLHQVGNRQGQVLAELHAAANEEHMARERAAEAVASARVKQRAQQVAKDRADRLVAEQGRVLALLKSRLAATRGAAARAHHRAVTLARAWRIAQQRARAMRARGVAQCRGGDLSGYPNGRLPVAGLCPLWGAPGEMLRPEAARAFNRMSQDYAATFGTTICIADSYRSYAGQVQMYRTRRQWAAYPGTSKHGWGRAVDLCGGVQNEGSRATRWMHTHAAAFGWFHPAWAEPGGAGPREPWHWEYAG